MPFTQPLHSLLPMELVQVEFTISEFALSIFGAGVLSPKFLG